MTRQPQDTSKDRPKNVLPDLVIPALAFAFTIYYLSTITEVPWIAQASAVTVSGLLLLTLFAFSIRTFFRIRRGRETISLAETRREFSGRGQVTRQRLVLLALTIGYLITLPWTGFTLGTFAFIFAGIVTLSSRLNWLRALLIALFFAALGYVIFIHLFRIRFPSGPVETLLKPLLKSLL